MFHAVINMKGGVGKTTTAVNVGAALARRGYRILVVDLDPQANATSWMATGDEPQATMANALADRKAITAAITPSTISGVDLAHGSRKLAGVADDLRATSPTPAFALRNALKKITGRYETILFDCPPGLSLLSLIALIAADSLIIPIDSQTMALSGVSQIQETISELIDGEVIDNAPTMKLLITMFDSRLSLDQEINKHLTDQGYDRFEKAIRTNTKLAEAFGLRKSIFDYAPSSTGAMDYDTLAGEMIK